LADWETHLQVPTPQKSVSQVEIVLLMSSADAFLVPRVKTSLSALGARQFNPGSDEVTRLSRELPQALDKVRYYY
jgi:hypothetical protein